MKWFKRKPELKYEYVPAPELLEPLTGIEKMEIERKLAERKATELRDAKLATVIAAKRAAIQPQLDEIQRLEQELSPRDLSWIFQNACLQQQSNLLTGLEQSNSFWNGLLGNAIGGGKA
jgi:hypothetical protein